MHGTHDFVLKSPLTMTHMLQPPLWALAFHHPCLLAPHGGSSQPTGGGQKALWTGPALLLPRPFPSGLALQGSCFNQSQQMKVKPDWPCSPCPPLTFRVGPEEVTHGPIVRHLLLSINRPDLVQSLDGRGEAPMHTEDLEGRARPEGKEAQVQNLPHHSSPKESLASLPCHR